MDKVINLSNELVDLFINKSEITGAFLSGSLAGNSYDEYSDVDLRFIVQTGDIISYTSDSKEEIKNNLNVLFFEPCPYFNNCVIAHFENFIKADIFFYTKEMLSPSPWLKDIKIMNDINNFLSDLKNHSKELSFTIPMNQIEDNIYKFISASHECYRRIKRKEFLYANKLLIDMKAIIILFYDYLFGRATLSFCKAEKRLESSTVKSLSLSITEETENITVLNNINDEFLRVEAELINRIGLYRNLDKDKYLLFYYQQ
ncbi:MAG: hypothetical protein A2Y15_01845 [Clostridiales bacterium GWF2_36_10]|nr:MAG: hypothetical protein A2Y15_01845 [Clostridiales bacterium GWF2_36_10]HAN21579.1 hypothetical protein [Clostridiales bacterium]